VPCTLYGPGRSSPSPPGLAADPVEAWPLAPSHAAPAAFAAPSAGGLARGSAFLPDAELGPIPPAADARALAYYALTAAAAASVSATAPLHAARGAGAPGGASARSGGASARGPGGDGSTVGGDLEAVSVASSDAAQAAARAEFFGHAGTGAAAVGGAGGVLG
jgi:hypothetical protein